MELDHLGVYHQSVGMCPVYKHIIYWSSISLFDCNDSSFLLKKKISLSLFFNPTHQSRWWPSLNLGLSGFCAFQQDVAALCSRNEELRKLLSPPYVNALNMTVCF